MKTHDKKTTIYRLEGFLKRRDAERTQRIRPAQVGSLAALGEDQRSRNLSAWLHAPECIAWPAGAEYLFRLGRHRLALSTSGGAGRHERAVARAEAEFALVVEGPLFVIGARFGTAMPWAWARPYHWRFTAPTQRIVPASIALTPRNYARLWATLWITLVDDWTGRVRVRRAVALRPEFAHTLHGVLRAQALRPYQPSTVHRAGERLHEALPDLALRACVQTRCAAVSEPEPVSRWATQGARTEQDDTGFPISRRQPQ
ncbi:hypothetical protein SAMN05444166_7870 [Singulisphaera sp. GP187]|uniref:hypothetical protein n=1 Tax=Singulisphaera sp. GP187 TaxID=1882752 RepID=UPI00092C7B60|nr:hypothetical protein [Singulisphaera sp. GP187]SIO65877.1 hypothetical protein SAMN05444166_7870 [Singulisphaera sp. GP187]